MPGPANYLAEGIWHHNSGKTNIGCKRIISSALANAPVPVAAVSPTFPLARRTVIPTILEFLVGKERLYGAAEFNWTYHRSHHEFYIRHRERQGMILILSGEEPTSLRGPNLGAVLMDEPFIQSGEVFKHMMARIRHPNAMHKEYLLVGTPEGTLNWGYDLIKGELRLRNDVGLVQASSRDNPVTGLEYVSKLEGVFGEREARAYIEGELISLSTGLVYYGAGEKNFVVLPPAGTMEGWEEIIRGLRAPQGAELGCGMDFNVNPMAFAVFWRWRDHMHFIREYELPNADTQYACSVLREDWGDKLRTIYPDPTGAARKTSSPAGKTDFHYIREAGFEISAPHAHPPLRDIYNAVNGKLGPKAGPSTLTVDPRRCPRLVKYLSTYSHEDMNTEEHKKMSHLLAGMRYAVHRLFPVTVGATAGRLSGV